MKMDYKETALGRMPEEWEVVKLGQVLSKIYGGGTPARDIEEYWNGNIPWATVKDLKAYHLKEPEEKITYLGLSNSSANLVPKGTLIIATRMALGKAVFFSKDVAINQDLKAICPDEDLLEKTYLFYWYLANSDLIESKGSGSTVKGIRLQTLKSLNIPIPPLNEQQKISAILSTLDEKIDVISERIAETETLKKGLMQHLFTKGIGHTQFKDSALGKVPKIWDIKKLSEFSKCFVGIASAATHAYTDEGIILVRNQNIKENKIELSDVLKVSREYEIQHKSKRLKAGDILVVRTGYPGISAVVPSELEGCQSFTTLIIRKNQEIVASDFLCYFINSEKGSSFFTSSKAGGGQKNVGAKTLENLHVPIPPKKEQQKMAAIFSSTYEKLEILKEKKETYQELKRGLMQVLLTGKIRVSP